MFAYCKSRFLAALALVLLIVLPAASARALELRERVAVLYATDGQSLYTVNPNNGHLHSLGAIKLDGPPIPAGWPLTSMVYDGAQRQLFVNANFLPPDSPQQILYRLNTQTTELSLPEQGTGVMLGMFTSLSYDWQTQRLCASIIGGPANTPVFEIDPTSGAETMITMGGGIGAWPIQRGFFDNRGNFWMFQQNDSLVQLREFSLQGDGQVLKSLSGTIYDAVTFGEGTWPRYHSFAFHPFSGRLFATFVRTKDGSLYGDYYTHLCTVNLQTGEPDRIIASYPTPNWTLQITWGMSD
jgi:hypothetical protein